MLLFYKKLFLSTLISLICLNLHAQKSDLGNWFMYFGNQRFHQKWNWWNEVQYRNYNFIGDMEQLLLRTGIGRDLSENNNNLLLGYAFINSTPYISGTDSKTSLTEHRIFQQFITRQRFERVLIQHRFRIEERFRPNLFRVRARYFLSLNILLNSNEMKKGTCYLSAYNEIFLHLNKPVFDRDRIYAGMGYAFNSSVRLETGIMYQLFETGNRPQWQFALYNSLPFKSTKPKQ